MASVTALVAHQGGWDEVLLVAGPVVLIIVVLTVAKRRVDRLERSTDGEEAGRASPGTGRRGRDVSGDQPTR